MNIRSNLSIIYDRFAEKYEANRSVFNIDIILNQLLNLVNVESGHLLDLGCGAGEPVPALFVSKGWAVTGVDFSEKMISLANKFLPEMHTILSDMTEVSFESDCFDLITAIYSLIHVEKEKNEYLFQQMHKWLKPGGLCLFTYACKEYTGYDEFSGYKDFMGESLFYSHFSCKKIRKILLKTGFDICMFKHVEIANETFLWIIVRKKQS